MKTSTHTLRSLSISIFVSFLKKIIANIIKSISYVNTCHSNLNAAKHINWSGFHKSKILQYSLLTAFFFLHSTTISHAATITSTSSGGNWGTGTTWVGGNAPGSSDNVVIASTATVSLAGSSTTLVSLTVYGTLQLAGKNLTFGVLQGTGIITNSGSTPIMTVGSDNISTTFSGVIGSNLIDLNKVYRRT